MEALPSLSPSTSRPYRPSFLLPRHLNPYLRRRHLHRHPSHITTKIRSQITSSPSPPPPPPPKTSTGLPTGTRSPQSATSTSGSPTPRPCSGSTSSSGGTVRRRGGRCLMTGALIVLHRSPKAGSISGGGCSACIMGGALMEPATASTFPKPRRTVPRYEVLVENLMDPAHVAYAHYGIMKVPKRSQPPGRVETDREGGVPIEITIESIDKSGFLSRNPFGYGHFVAPCLFNSFPRLPRTTTLPGVPEESSAIATQQQKRILLIFLCIPVSPGRSRVIWVFPRNFSVWLDQLIPRWIFHIGQNLILDSDIYLLHLEERKIAEAGPSNWQKACYVPTKSDAMVVAFRKWIRKYAQSQVDWGTNSHHLPPTPPKEQLMDRYWSHVVNCISCRRALQGLKALQIALQVASIAVIGILAAARQSLVSVVARAAIVSAALLCFLASKWLSHFIYKTFYFHDYNHAFR